MARQASESATGPLSADLADEAACGAAAGPDLGWGLHVLSRGYAARAQCAVAELPNGLRGYLLLTRVAHENAASQLALASQLGLDRTVMTYLIDDLQAAGLVERRPDPTDRRARQVFITTAGAAALHRAQGKLADAETETLTGLSATERQTLRNLVHRVAGTLSADPESGAVAQACSGQDVC